MKKTSIILIALSIVFTSFAQTVKVHESEITQKGLNIMPDEMGYVQMTEEAYNKMLAGEDISSQRNNPPYKVQSELFSGFPVFFDGTSDKNAVYLNLDDDPELEMIYTGFQQLHAFNTDGSIVDGWPTITMTNYIEKSLAVGDITGDGVPEIIVATRYSSSGWIYAFDLNGVVIDNFPINHGFNGGAPTLYDIDGDDKMEIIISKRTYPTGEIYIYNEDGTIVDGWGASITTPHIPTGSISVADIDNDGQPEVVVAYYEGVKAFEHDGTEIFHFELPEGMSLSYSSPVIANIDDTPEKEISFATCYDPKVYVLDNTGNTYPGWPQSTTWSMYAHVSIADINQDGTLDVFCGDQILGADNYYIYGWDKDANALDGFPIVTTWAINTQLLIADIDNDQQLEIISDDNYTYGGTAGKYHAYNHDGTQTDDWPLDVTGGSSFYKSPTIFDADNDGNLDFMGACGDDDYNTYPHLWKLNVPVPAANLLPLTTSQYNLQRTGEYIPPTQQDAYSVTFNVTGELEPEITLTGYGTQTATGGTTIFNDVTETPDPGISYTVELAGYQTINNFVIVDENETVNIDLTPTNISEIENTISIYPNPSNGTFYIKNPQGFENLVGLVITDITGKTIYKSKFVIPNSQFVINKKGIYFIKIQTENNIYTEKIIIQ